MATKKIQKFNDGGMPDGTITIDATADTSTSPTDVLGGDYGGASSGDTLTGNDYISSLIEQALNGGYSNSSAPTGNAASGATMTGQGGTQNSGEGGDLGILGKVLKATGLSSGKGGLGGVDLTDPNTLARLAKVMGAAGSVYDILSGNNKPPATKTPSEIKAMFASPFSGFTPAGQAAYDHMNSTPYASRTPRALKVYAGGGMVDDNNPQFFSEGALSRYTGGSAGGGQDDLIPARLAGGEYVMDADTVASVGDGNNQHGAAKLDAWRENLRAHKRAAPASAIPPKTKHLDSYMPKGKK